jgi:hypothetical protein
MKFVRTGGTSGKIKLNLVMFVKQPSHEKIFGQVFPPMKPELHRLKGLKVSIVVMNTLPSAALLHTTVL